MKALAVFPRDRAVRVVDQRPPDTDLAPTKLLLETIEVGICGTDREIAAFEYGAPPDGDDNLVLGHEAIAKVVDIGSSVHTLRSGAFVVPTVRRPCEDPSCAACRAGRPDFCTTGGFRERGIKGAHGFMAELVVEEETNLVPLPTVLAEVGVLVEPLTIAAKAAAQIAAIQDRLPWDRVSRRGLVLGAGAVGLLGAMMLVANRYETFVYSREPSDGDRAKLVRSFGAGYASALEVDVGALRNQLGPMDVVFEATGVSPLAFAAAAALAPNGIFVFTGVPSRGPPRSFDTDRMMHDLVLQNQVFLGTVNAGRGTYEAAISELEQFLILFPDSVRAILARHRSIDEAPRLLREGDGIKDVVRLSDSQP
jgi:threonine dehydrogenase-like Zn-dependent dehydrogenase